MRKRKQQVSKDNLTVSKSNKRSSTSGGEIEYFDRIHVDLLVNILSKLPIKYIAKCRCISKLWSSIIRIPNYNLLFPIKYPVTPRFLFAFEVVGNLFFYSSPQPQNPDKNSSLVAIHYDHTNSVTDIYKLCRPVRGLVCRQQIGKKYTLVVVSNPITGEFVTSPKLKLEGIRSEWINRKVRFSFGYNPIEKQFKVLHITLLCRSQNSSCEYQVLTLGVGKGNLFWRKIQCRTIHYPLDDNGICINGVLYYLAILINNEKHTIVCFDVKSEKFSFINIDQDMATKISEEAFTFSLIDYKGKLSACNCDIKHNLFELWVLEDAEKHKWSKHIYQMSHPWLNGKSYVRTAGMIGSGEIVLYQCYTRDPFFVFYYNFEMNIITRVRVEVPLLEEF